MRRYQAYVEHAGIILQPFERYGSIGELRQLSLAFDANCCCVWRLCIALGTGLHAGPPELFSPIVIQVMEKSRRFGNRRGRFQKWGCVSSFADNTPPFLAVVTVIPMTQNHIPGVFVLPGM
jgi:hypothetical protein